MKRETMTAAEFRAMPKPKRSKYGVRQDAEGKARRTVDWYGKPTLFASQAEAQRAGELQMREKARGRVIEQLRRQVPIMLAPKSNGNRAVTWIVDFAYQEFRKFSIVVVFEDVKGAPRRGKKKGTDTEAFRLKLNLARRQLRPGQMIRIRYADGTVKEYRG